MLYLLARLRRGRPPNDIAMLPHVPSSMCRSVDAPQRSMPLLQASVCHQQRLSYKLACILIDLSTSRFFVQHISSTCYLRELPFLLCEGLCSRIYDTRTSQALLSWSIKLI